MSINNPKSEQAKKCSAALRLLADPVVIAALAALASRPLRFNQLKRITSSNAVTLTNKLKSLESAHIVHRQASDPQQVTYRLTELGNVCMPIVEAINQVAHELQAHGIDDRRSNSTS